MSQNSSVVPISWDMSKGTLPSSNEAIIWNDDLQLISKYLVHEAWDSLIGNENLGSYFDLGKRYHAPTIRPIAQMAFALAVNVSLDVYDENVIGQSKSVAFEKIRTIIKSIARAHLVNGGNYNKYWGNSHQSAHWASVVGQSAWLIWDSLISVDQMYIKNMIEYEANRFNELEAAVANDTLFLNTRAEDNGWNAWALEVASAMMPNHAHFDIWQEKSIQLRMTAVARKEDLFDSTYVDGSFAFEWMDGYNVSVDYAVGNHQAYPHPDYSATTIFQPLRGALIWSLAGLEPPQACFYNQKQLYSMFFKRIWNDSSVIYKEDGKIYWPIAIEKERSTRYYKYAVIDALSQLFNIYEPVNEGQNWEEMHLHLLGESIDPITGLVQGDVWIHEPAFSVALAYLAYWMDENGVLKSVFPIDEIPPTIISANSVSVLENTLGSIYTLLADESAVFTLGTSKDEGFFTLSTDTLSFMASPDYEQALDSNGDNIYLLDVAASDSTGNSSTMELSIKVTDLDEIPPTITSANSVSVLENIVGSIYTLLADEQVVFTLGTSKDEGLFTLSTDTLSFIAYPDYEQVLDSDGDNIYLLDVTASDSTGNSSTMELSVKVKNENDNSPVFNNRSLFEINENIREIAQLSVSDADGDSIRLHIIGGSDQTFFMIREDLLQFKSAPDYETYGDNNGDNIYEALVQATDGMFITDLSIKVRVMDLFEEVLNNINNEFKLYPNPVKNVLHLDDVIPYSKVWVIDSQGKELTILVNDDSLDVRSIPDGHYLLFIKGPKGIKNYKFVKKN